MSENVTEVLAGGAVLAVAAAFAVYAAQSAGLGAGQVAGRYELTASFRSAEGVAPGTDVRLAGVRIGSVTALSLNPQTFFADARFGIDAAVAIPADSAALISSEGLLGGNFVEIQPGGAVETLAPGDEIEDTQGAVSLISLMMKFVTGGDGAGTDAAMDAP